MIIKIVLLEEFLDLGGVIKGVDGIYNYREEELNGQNVRLYKLEKGDTMTLKVDKKYKIGSTFEDYPTLRVDKSNCTVYYDSKDWWKFWKRKKFYTVVVTYMGKQDGKI